MDDITDHDICFLFDSIAEKLFPYDAKRRNELAALIYDTKIVIGTSIMTNINNNQPLNACTVMETDLNQSFDDIKKEIEIPSVSGMGVGFSLNSSSNPKEALFKLNRVLQSIDENCRRPVAGITNLDVSHPQIIDYLQAKRAVDFSHFKFNISVSANNQFMHDIIDSSASVMDDSIFTAIADNMHYCGEPGLVFMERIEETNPVPSIKFESFSPCAELAMAKGEACQFSYINLGQMLIQDDTGKPSINWKLIESSSRILTRALDESVQISINHAVFDTRVLAAKRRIGIGVCGYADMLIELGSVYGSKESNEILQNILTLINFSSKDESMHLAAKHGAFSAFPKSRYVTDSEFIMRFANQGDVSRENWQQLNKDILKFGLRNSSTTALPPTGNSSLLIGASNSIEPLFTLKMPFTKKPIKAAVAYINSQEHFNKQEKSNRLSELKNSKDNTTLITDKFLAQLFRTATEITPQEHLGVVIAGQACIDDAISKTINMHNSAIPAEISALLKQAYLGGAKGISIFREGCLSERQSYKNGDVIVGNSRLQ